MRVAAFNAGLRITGLGSRFVLSMFMARFMTLQDIGTFALLTGVTGLLPSVAGLGLNFFLSRALVGLDHERAIRLTFDRMVITLIASLIACALAVVLAGAGLVDIPLPLAIVSGIIILELAGFDIQMALLARSRSTFANFLLFFRTGFWPLPFMMAAYAFPSLRNVTDLGVFWLGGLVVSHIVTWVVYKKSIISVFKSVSQWKADFLRGLGSSIWKIYLSDLGLAGSVYIDRFIISYFLGLYFVGAYFFYSSIINSIYIVCMAATVQIYQPEMRKAFSEGGINQLHVDLVEKLKKTVLVTFVMFAISMPMIYAVCLVTGKSDIMKYFYIVPILMVSYLAKIVSDFLGVALASVEHDGYYAYFNMVNLVITSVLCVILVFALGVTGAALANLFAGLAMVAIRVMHWRKVVV